MLEISMFGSLYFTIVTFKVNKRSLGLHLYTIFITITRYLLQTYLYAAWKSCKKHMQTI